MNDVYIFCFLLTVSNLSSLSFCLTFVSHFIHSFIHSAHVQQHRLSACSILGNAGALPWGSFQAGGDTDTLINTCHLTHSSGAVRGGLGDHQGHQGGLLP